MYICTHVLRIARLTLTRAFLRFVSQMLEDIVGVHVVDVAERNELNDVHSAFTGLAFGDK